MLANVENDLLTAPSETGSSSSLPLLPADATISSTVQNPRGLYAQSLPIAKVLDTSAEASPFAVDPLLDKDLTAMVDASPLAASANAEPGSLQTAERGLANEGLASETTSSASDDLLMGGLDKQTVAAVSAGKSSKVYSDLPSSQPKSRPSQAALTDSDGVFVVDGNGQVEVDFLFDGGGYAGELAAFSLAGMENLSTQAFIQEAIERVTNESPEDGQIVVDDIKTGAQFSGRLGEKDRNQGPKAETQVLKLAAGSQFAIAFSPNGTFADMATSSDVLPPLFSIAALNPNGSAQMGQAANGVLGIEDLSIGTGDADFNDLVVRIRGAQSSAIALDQIINPAKNWLSSPLARSFFKEPQFSGPQKPINPEPPIEPPSPDTPPVAEPSKKAPPVVETPPIADLPVEKPPVAKNPPVESPTTEAPPVAKPQKKESPVAETPVAETPISDEPKAKDPTVVEQPPVAELPIEKEQPADDKPINDKPVNEKPVDEKPVDEKPVDEKPVDEKPIVEKPPVQEPIAEAPPADKAPPLTTKVVSDISGQVNKFTPSTSETELAASGADRITIGTQTIYIGTQQVTSINQNPIIRSVDPVNASNNWLRTDIETTGTDGRGLGLVWTGEALYGVFSVDGTQGSPSEDFRRAADGAQQNWLKSFGPGGGKKIAVIGQIDPATGDLKKAAHLSAVLGSGATNSLDVKGITVNKAGNLVVSASSFSNPRRPDGSPLTKNPGNTAGSPFDYTLEVLPDLSKVVSTSAPGWS